MIRRLCFLSSEHMMYQQTHKGCAIIIALQRWYALLRHNGACIEAAALVNLPSQMPASLHIRRIWGTQRRRPWTTR